MKSTKKIQLNVMLFLVFSILSAHATSIEMSDYKEYLENNTPVNWDQYPYYTAYEKIMEKWARDYPEICSLHDLGPSVNNRKILALKISDSVAVNEPEPRLMQIATQHGDELINFMFTLHTIDTLLSSYKNDDRLTRLVDMIEFWFCPLVNPDATYVGGDTTISKAQRRNMNNKDLDRNWPCACMIGDHKLFGEYKVQEPEIMALMGLHERYTFNLHIDMHGGTEAVVWPYGGKQEKACDEKWYMWACERMAVQMQDDANNNGYMTSCGNDGIGHLFSELYEAHGARIDFCDRYAHIKGVRFENWVRKKIPEASELFQFWPLNREAIFQYYELLLTGIQGVVTDASTKKPIHQVNITADGHDYDSADVYTDSTGFFCRFIETGSYSFTFSHPDYGDTTVSGIHFSNYDDKIILNVELGNPVEVKHDIDAAKHSISLVPLENGIKIQNRRGPDNPLYVSIYTLKGKRLRLIYTRSGSVVWNGKDSQGNLVGTGCYIIHVRNGQHHFTKEFLLH